jgi:hypothetical protein
MMDSLDAMSWALLRWIVYDHGYWWIIGLYLFNWHMRERAKDAEAARVRILEAENATDLRRLADAAEPEGRKP